MILLQQNTNAYYAFLNTVKETLDKLENGYTTKLDVPDAVFHVVTPETIVAYIRSSYEDGLLPAHHYLDLRYTYDTQYHYTLTVCHYDPSAWEVLEQDDDELWVKKEEKTPTPSVITDARCWHFNDSDSDWGTFQFREALEEGEGKKEAPEEGDPSDESHDVWWDVEPTLASAEPTRRQGDLESGELPPLPPLPIVVDSEGSTWNTVEEVLDEEDDEEEEDKEEEEEDDVWYDAVFETFAPSELTLVIGKHGTGKTNVIRHLISMLPTANKRRLLAVSPTSPTREQDDGRRGFSRTYNHAQALTYARQTPGSAVIVLDDCDIDERDLVALLKVAREHKQSVLMAVPNLKHVMAVEPWDNFVLAHTKHGHKRLYRKFYEQIFDSFADFTQSLKEVERYTYMFVNGYNYVLKYAPPCMPAVQQKKVKQA